MSTRRSSLAALLRNHLPADPAEATFRRRMQALLEVDADPFARDHFTPGHFTASAFLLSPDDRALLLIHHQKLKRWLQPGGHVDPEDSDIFAAARREVREEVGLDRLRPHALLAGIFDIDIHVIPERAAEPAHEHFDVRFLFAVDRTDATAGSDAEATRWVELERVADVESDASVMRAVSKLRLLLRGSGASRPPNG